MAAPYDAGSVAGPKVPDRKKARTGVHPEYKQYGKGINKPKGYLF